MCAINKINPMLCMVVHAYNFSISDISLEGKFSRRAWTWVSVSYWPSKILSCNSERVYNIEGITKGIKQKVFIIKLSLPVSKLKNNSIYNYE